MFTLSKKTLIISVIFLTVSSAFVLNHPADRNEGINKYYSSQLKLVDQSLSTLRNACTARASADTLKKVFLQARLAYKRIALLVEYFDVYEFKNLNAPAINRIEEDNAFPIIPPHGFQQLEVYLFSAEYPSTRKNTLDEITLMQNAISRIEKQPDRLFKFKDELTWDALRNCLLGITALGVTGFDSPLANYSIEEAAASLSGLKELLAFFETDLAKKDKVLITHLYDELDAAITYLNAHLNFNKFDRARFIRSFINPLYADIVRGRKTLLIPPPPGNRPINYDNESMFGAAAMNLNYFSPEPQYQSNDLRVALGKKLFYDPILSGTGTRSCGSCHQPEKAFADGLVKPLMIEQEITLNRNTPTLWNSVFQASLFYDSRVSGLETQLAEVVHNKNEMQGSLLKQINELKSSPGYVKLFSDAYKDQKNPMVAFTLANAIASYVRSLVAMNSRFDKYMLGDSLAMNASEVDGLNLYTGKARCATCHYLPLMNGFIPPYYNESESEVIGVPARRQKKNATLDADPGKYGFTNSVVHKFSFKTPTLRNIALTAPYMHNGVYKTLEEVMGFYNNGGGAGLDIAPENMTLARDKLHLSKHEIRQVISFLKALTDTSTMRYIRKP